MKRNYKTKKKRNKIQSGRSEKASFDEFKQQGNINPKLWQACWELKYEMFWASKKMEVEELLRNSSKEYECGFWQGWRMCYQADEEIYKILEEDGDCSEFET